MKCSAWPVISGNASTPTRRRRSLRRQGLIIAAIWGGGFGANARWLFYQKHIETGIHYLGGKGIGRYGDTTLADLTVNPAGQLKALQNYQMLASLEWHSPKWDFYGYGGGEYDGRTWYHEPVGLGRSATARRCSTTPAAERKPCRVRARLIMRRRQLRAFRPVL